MTSSLSFQKNGLLIVLLGVVGFLLCVEAVTPPPPFTVVSEFYDPHFIFTLGGAFGSGVPGAMWYSESYQSWKNTFSIELFPPNVWQNITFLQAPTQFYYEADGVCRSFGNDSFNSLFNWLPYGSYVGIVTLPDGRVTDEWILPTHNGPLIFNANHANNSIPVRFIFPTVPITSTSLVNYTFLFSDSLVPGAFSDPSSVFGIPDSCNGSGLICEPAPSAPVSQDMDFYLFHEPSDFTLVNTNVADVPGDTFFVCGAVSTGNFGYFQWLSWWQITVNTTWGQYEFCNFGSCFGGNDTLVGREAAEGLGEHGGQCTSGNGTTNSIIGSWYSLPANGLCAEGTTVGTNGCTWQINGRMKTINGSCLFSNGFQSACLAGFSSGNLTAAQQLFLQAFISDDPAENGCPPLPGPEFTATSATDSSTFSKAVRSQSSRSSPLLSTAGETPRVFLEVANAVSTLHTLL